MNQVALFRSGRDLRQVKLVPVDRAAELIDYARAGDTLHSIPEDMSHTSSDVLRCIYNNLEVGYFTPV